MAWDVAVYDYAASTGQTTLNSVTGNATGTVIDMTQGRYSVTVVATSTGTLTGTVTMTGSIDGTNWYPVGAAGAVAAGTTVAFSSGGIAFRYARAALSAAVGSGTMTVKILGIN